LRLDDEGNARHDRERVAQVRERKLAAQRADIARPRRNLRGQRIRFVIGKPRGP
jgi:hypothetical protein